MSDTVGKTKNYSKGRAAVIRYFLKIFKRQINAPVNAPFEVKRINVLTFGPKHHTFELKVEHQGDWTSRRMTIAPLGEESGSKSMCFYVIYDEHLVVKIPPTPITDLNQYIESIYADRRIVFRLEPRECVVPSISVILKRIHTFPGENLMSEKLEGKYISWIRNNPAFQEYLQIDGEFVFFMDLSKYSILGDVLSQMHFEKDSQVFQEITENKGVILELENFEGRYGKSKLSICFDLKKIYTEYEARILEILSSSRKPASTLQYKIEPWFLRHLADSELDENEKDITDETAARINQLIQEILAKNSDTAAAYKSMIYEHIYKKFFSVKKPQMEGIITNILDLLAWLKEKGVAMRDFKPDNLLVTGDPEKNPNYLSSPHEYMLGLIDVETSIIYEAPDQDKPDQDKIDQPQLGGTPFFATPSQLFFNELLDETFGDIPRIFCLQDWYAAVVMIYYVVTGERLFEQTARKLPAIIKTIQTAMSKKQKPSEFMEKANKNFWQSAVSEISINIKKREKLLKSVMPAISDNAKTVLLDFLRHDRIWLNQNIKDQISSQALLKSEKNQDQLYKSSYDQIKKLRLNWENNKSLPQAQLNQKNEIVDFLTQLEKLKAEIEQIDSTIRTLTSSSKAISAYALIDIMFNIVYKNMYQKKWGDIGNKMQVSKQN